MALTLSVVVPVRNEAALAPALGQRLAALAVDEVIIVDGGSTDGTPQRLEHLAGPGIRFIEADPGRAAQMNTGARRASGDVLVFLHADTRLPPDAPRLIARGLRHRPDRRWGRFDVRFDSGDPLLGMVARAMNLRSALTSICTGDQCLFVHRDEFLALGGFAPIALMEDIELSRRLRRRSRPLRIRTPAVTSARRWRAHGTLRTIWLMWRLRWRFWWGASPAALAGRYYGKH